MAKKTTIVSIVLDESGSMDAVRDATISGFNEYVNTLRKEKGKILLTLTQFNGARINTPYVAVPLKDVKEMTRADYVPGDMTPLYDAVGKAIHETEAKRQSIKTPTEVLCVIMTDGYENVSKEHTLESLKSLIKSKEADGWTFVYLGANQDAWAVGATMGLSQGNVANYNAAQPMEAFAKSASATVKYMRSTGAKRRSLLSED